MKKLLSVLMTLLVLSAANAQCPKSFTLNYPKIALSRGDTFAISVYVDTPLDIIYHWTVSSGKIIGGQGTESIIIAANTVTNNLAATVQLGGLPKGCDVKRSVSIRVNPPKNRRELIKTL